MRIVPFQFWLLRHGCPAMPTSDGPCDRTEAIRERSAVLAVAAHALRRGGTQGRVLLALRACGASAHVRGDTGSAAASRARSRACTASDAGVEFFSVLCASGAICIAFCARLQ